MDVDERSQLRDTMRAILRRTEPSEVPGVLVENGWDDIVESEPVVALSALFEQKGVQLSAAPLLGFATASVLGVPSLEHQVLIPAMAADAADMNRGFSVNALALAAGEPTSWLLLPKFPTPQGRATVLAANPTAQRHDVHGIDPSYGLSRVQGVWPERDVTLLSAEHSEALAAVCARALAQEHLAVLDGTLQLAVSHVMSREQFGRPLGGFQAVKHLLATAHVAIAGARAVLEEAWFLGDPFLSVTSVGAVETAAEVVRGGCQQVCGAIGFTDEHLLPRYLRRSLLLGSLLASSRTTLRHLGDHILARSEVPRFSNVRSATETVFASR